MLVVNLDAIFEKSEKSQYCVIKSKSFYLMFVYFYATEVLETLKSDSIEINQ